MDPEEIRVGVLLRQHRATLATAESCTGGLIGHLVTNVSGSSDYYLGGVIAYANQVKCEMLSVRTETLDRAGAVSQEVAIEMARGVRRLLDTDYGLSVTGIAGPTGGTPNKPVGLTFVGLVGPGIEHCEQHVWAHDRLGNKQATARRALQMLIERLEERT